MDKKTKTIYYIIFLGLLSLLFLYFQPEIVKDLFTRVVLDNNLKPDYAPGVIMGEDTLQNAGGEAAFGNYLLQLIAGSLISIAAPVAIIIIAIAGLLAVTSAGDTKAIDKVKKTMTGAILGLIVIIFSWIIVRAVINIVIEINPSDSSTQTNAQNESPAKEGGTIMSGGE